MKTSIEEINGKKYTVVWYWNTLRTFEQTLRDGSIIFGDALGDHIATALPALPRNPKPEDAPLLYRYAAEGIWAQIVDHGDKSVKDWPQRGEFTQLHPDLWVKRDIQIYEAIDKDGNTIDIAIEEIKND